MTCLSEEGPRDGNEPGGCPTQDLHGEETCPVSLPERGLSEGAGCPCTCRGLAVGYIRAAQGGQLLERQTRGGKRGLCRELGCTLCHPSFLEGEQVREGWKFSLALIGLRLKLWFSNVFHLWNPPFK